MQELNAKAQQLYLSHEYKRIISRKEAQNTQKGFDFKKQHSLTDI